jgi:DNA polymerase-3 subunit delta'
LAFKPYEGKIKTAVVREADRLSEDSGGALLKTLEEPSENTLIILTAVSSSAVMGTLVSRCLTIPIPPLTRGEILREVIKRRGLKSPKAELVAGLAGGALGAALEMDEERAWSFWGNLDSLFAVVKGPRRHIAALKLAEQITGEYDKLKKLKDDPDGFAAHDYLELFCQSARLWFRDCAVLASVGDKAFLDGPDPSPAQTLFSKRLPLKRLNHYEEAVRRLSDDISRFIRADLVFENFFRDVLQ